MGISLDRRAVVTSPLDDRMSWGVVYLEVDGFESWVGRDKLQSTPVECDRIQRVRLRWADIEFRHQTEGMNTKRSIGGFLHCGGVSASNVRNLLRIASSARTQTETLRRCL